MHLHEIRTNLSEVSEDLLLKARNATSGKAAQSIYGGSGHQLRQTLIAIRGGANLPEHDNPGEATLYVLQGGIEMTADGENVSAQAGDVVHIPQARHGVLAVSDAVILLTTVLQ